MPPARSASSTSLAHPAWWSWFPSTATIGTEVDLVLLHYAPITETIVGEPEAIWAFLGSGRLAGPIGMHRPDLVVHGHAHHGATHGAIGTVPVHNVAVHVTGVDFAIFVL